jgi:hypothetical protein
MCLKAVQRPEFQGFEEKTEKTKQNETIVISHIKITLKIIRPRNKIKHFKFASFPYISYFQFIKKYSNIIVFYVLRARVRESFTERE